MAKSCPSCGATLKNPDSCLCGWERVEISQEIRCERCNAPYDVPIFVNHKPSGRGYCWGCYNEGKAQMGRAGWRELMLEANMPKRGIDETRKEYNERCRQEAIALAGRLRLGMGQEVLAGSGGVHGKSSGDIRGQEEWEDEDSRLSDIPF